MQRGASRRIRGSRTLAGLALCLAAAGCGSIGQTLRPSAQARGVSDFSVALESIDGLPRDVSQQLARDLNEEAAALRIAVVPPGGEATYRMRGYVAARSAASITSISWAWDVYDGELHRAFRLSGEERAGPAPARDAGRALADEAVLRAIARTGMRQLADFAASAPAPAAPASPAPGRTGSAVASRGEVRSDAARLADATAGR